MSGAVESASLLLTAFPPLIAAVEAFEGTIRAFRRFAKKRAATDTDLKRFSLEFRTQRALLQNTITVLCHEADISAAASESLVNGNLVEQDLQEEINTSLKKYLGKKYGLFVTTIKAICRSVEAATESFQVATDSSDFGEPDSDAEKRLLRSIEWVGRREKKTEKLLSNVSIHYMSLDHLLQNIVISKGRLSEIQDVAQAIAQAVVSDDLHDSDVSSVDTMPLSDEDENQLSYLSIYFQGRTEKSERERTRWTEGLACLDSAATKYCISDAFAKTMRVHTEKIERREVNAYNGQKFFYYSQAKLTFSWTDGRKTLKQRNMFCIIPNLFQSAVLPNDFINRQEGILKLAHRRQVPESCIATMGFPFRSRGKKESDQQQADAARNKAKQREDDLVNAQQSALDQKYGVPSSTSQSSQSHSPTMSMTPTQSKSQSSEATTVTNPPSTSTILTST